MKSELYSAIWAVAQRGIPGAAAQSGWPGPGAVPLHPATQAVRMGSVTADMAARVPSAATVVTFCAAHLIGFAIAMLVLLGGLQWPATARAAVPATPDIPVVLGPKRTDHVLSELVADQQAVRPGQPLRIGLKLIHDAGWHTYWRNPGDSGLPTLFEPTGPDGTRFGPIVWPMPERLAIGPLANYGYEGEVLLARTVEVPADIAGPVRFEVHAQWLVCREVCIPGEARLGLELPLATGDAAAAPVWSHDQPRFNAAAEHAPDPAQAREADARIASGRLGLLLPAGLDASRAEFFPYFEAVVTPAADQRLLAASSPGGRQQMDLAVADDAVALDSLEPALRAGLLVADGRPIELHLQPLVSAPAPGELIATAQVRQPSPGAGAAAQSTAPGGGSLLSAVRSMAGATGATGAAAPAAPAAAGWAWAGSPAAAGSPPAPAATAAWAPAAAGWAAAPARRRSWRAAHGLPVRPRSVSASPLVRRPNWCCGGPPSSAVHGPDAPVPAGAPVRPWAEAAARDRALR